MVKKLTAWCLLWALLLTSIPSNCITVLAAENESQAEAAKLEKNMLSAITESLEKESPEIAERYPGGLFTFATLIGEMEEDSNNPLIVYLVRHGGTEGEKTVRFKLTDYSAEYGKDYTVKLKDSYFAKPLEKNEASEPILYAFSDEEASSEPLSMETLKEAYDEDTIEEIKALLMEDTEGKTAEDVVKSAAVSPLSQLNEDVSQYGATPAVRVETASLTPAQEAEIDRNEKLIDLLLPGTEGTVTFRDGEQVKELYVYAVDNNVSDGDRVFQISLPGEQKDGVSTESDINSAAMTIHDDEPDETAVVSLAAEAVTADPDGKFEIPLTREHGLYKVSMAAYEIKDETGKVLAEGKTAFMPGMDTRTVRVELTGKEAFEGEQLTFSLKEMQGAELSGPDRVTVGLSDYLSAHPGVSDIPEEDTETPEALGTANSVGKTYSTKDNMYGYIGSAYEDFFDIAMDMGNVTRHYDNGKDGDYKDAKIDDDGSLHFGIGDRNCGANGATGGVLFQKIYPIMLESLEMNWDRDDHMGGSRANRTYIALSDRDVNEYDKCEQWVYEAYGEGNDTAGRVWFTDGHIEHIDAPDAYKNSYMDFGTYYRDGGSQVSFPLTVGVRKTSGAVNGMELRIKNIRLNFRKYQITIDDAQKLSGHNDSPGSLRFKDGTNRATFPAYATVPMQESGKPDTGYSYLKGLQVSKDGQNGWKDVDASLFSTSGWTLQLTPDFFEKYYGQVDYKNASIHIRPVYGQVTVPVKLAGGIHGGMTVTYQDAAVDGNPTKTINIARGERETIRCMVGSTLNADQYDVETSANEAYVLTSFELTPDQGGEESPYYMVYPYEEKQVVMGIENCDYTMTPVYTHNGTEVKIEINGSVPAGCGLKQKTTDAQGNTVNKTLYTYSNDHLRAGQILELDAVVAEGYRAKWTILSKGHKDYDVTCYGDTFYYDVETVFGVIELSFEKADNAYTRVSGKVQMPAGSILNPPIAGDESGMLLGDPVPVENASVQAGRFTGVTGTDGRFLLYTHTEADDSGNQTEYFKMGAGTEKRAVKINRNGIEQVFYLDFKRAGTSGQGTSSDNPDTAEAENMTVGFYGKGPRPKDFYTLVGNEDSQDDPGTSVQTATVELRNYTIGFHATLASVLDEKGNDLVDHVTFTIVHKDGIPGRSFEVERKTHGQTEYELVRYTTTNSEGKTTAMNLNGLIDFEDGDEIYVEAFGRITDKDGNAADYGYGMYRSGVSFIEIPGEGIELSIPQITSAGGDSEESLDALPIINQMIPALNFGKFNASFTYDEASDSMLVNVGFNVYELKGVLFDEDKHKLENKISDLEQNLEYDEKKLNTDKETLAILQEKIDRNEKLNERQMKLYSELQADVQLEELNVQNEQNELNALKNEYNTKFNQDNQSAKNKMEPVPKNDTDLANANTDVTADEIADPVNVAEHALEDSEPEKQRTNPFSKAAKEKVQALKNQAKALGLDQPRNAGVENHGSLSFRMGVDIGLSMRFVGKEVSSGKSEYCFDYALIYASVSGMIQYVHYFVFPQCPIPLYLGVTANASIGVYNGLTTVESAAIPYDKMKPGEYDESKLLYEGMVPVVLGLELFAGAGLRSLLCLEVGFGVMQKFNFSWVAGYNGADSHQTGTGMTSLYGYLSISALFLSYKWKFWQENWSYTLYNEYLENGASPADAEALIRQNLPKDIAIADMTVSEPVSVESYKDPAFTAFENEKYYGGLNEEGIPPLGASFSFEGTTKIADGLTDTYSKIVSLGKDTYLMAFEGTLARSDRTGELTDANIKYNNRAVYLSLYEDGRVQTAILQKDGTNDASVSLERIGDQVVLSWASADRVFEHDDVMSGKFEDGEELAKPDALVKVLSSMDLYTVVLNTGEVSDFVSASPEEKLEKITRLTNDQESAKGREEITGVLESDASYLGYGYETERAVSVGDAIYLFYTAVDYNQWAGMDAKEHLSEIVNADGYVLYRIYDTKTQTWTESYGEESLKESYESRGLPAGTRLADVHLKNEKDGSMLLPSVGEMDAAMIRVMGEDRLLLSYLVEGDGIVSNNNENDGEAKRLLFFAFMKPAEISDGRIVREPSWSIPVEFKSDYASIYQPTLEKLSNNGEDRTFLVYAEDDDLKYIDLKDYAETIYDEETKQYYEPIKKTVTRLQDGTEVESWEFTDEAAGSVAIFGGEENGFSCRNGYDLASDGKDQLYVVWAQSMGNSQGLMLATMSLIDGQPYWSAPQMMDWKTDNENGYYYLENPSIGVDEEGDMLIAHNAYDRELVTGINKEGKEVAVEKRHVKDSFNLTYQKAVGSALVSDAAISEEYPRAGEDFTVSATITNDGFIKADEITVRTELIELSADGVTETEKEGKDQSLTDRLPASYRTISETFTMKQEYLDSAVNNGSTFFIRIRAKESGYDDESVEELPIRIGAKYVFVKTRAEGYLSDDIRYVDGGYEKVSDSRLSRYVIASQIRNDGNIASLDTVYDIAYSNEKASDMDYPGFDGATLKADITKEEMKESLNGLGRSVARNEDYTDWFVSGSRVLDPRGVTKEIGVGEEVTVWLVTSRFEPDCFSESCAMNLALIARDSTYAENDAVESQDVKVFAVTEAKEKKTALRIRSGSELAQEIYVSREGTTKLDALILPLTEALKYQTVWKSSDENVAVVEQDGTVIPKALGLTTITAAIQTKEGEVSYGVPCYVVEGADKIDDIVVSLSEAELTVKPGKTRQLIVTTYPEVEENMIRYGTDTPSVASVERMGTRLAVTGLSEGKAEITVRVGRDVRTCEVTVQEKEPEAVTYPELEKIAISDDAITLSYEKTAVYQKAGAKPKLTLTDTRYEGGKVLVEGKDYTVTYANNKAVTTDQTKKKPTFTVKGKKLYTGKLPAKEFTITPRPLSSLDISAADLIYKNKANAYQKAKLTLAEADGKKLNTKDYRILSFDPESGTPSLYETVQATLTAKSLNEKGSGNYEGSVTVSYKLIDSEHQISKAKVVFQAAPEGKVGEAYDSKRKGFIFDNAPVEPVGENMAVTIKVKENGKKVPKLLTEGTDYQILSYTKNTKTGTGKLVLKGIGEYGGTKTVSYKILKPAAK